MAKIRSFGAKVYVDGDLVGGLTDVNVSGGDVTYVDTTDHSLTDGYKSFLGGLKDGGTLELTGKYNYSDAGQATLRTQLGDTVNFYVLLSDNSGFAFTGIIGACNESNPLDDATEFTASCKITGEVFPVYPTIAIAGTLTSNGSASVTFPSLVFTNVDANLIVYTDTGDEQTADYSLSYGSGKWQATGPGCAWESNSDTLTPDEATGWTPVAPATGTPTITGA